MRLAAFVLENREPILEEWVTFARSCVPSGGQMDIVALRDHADEMLTEIVADLDTPQSDRQQREKGKGRAPDADESTAATEHGAERAISGFTVDQMVAEYRALRASVIRLWTESQGELTAMEVGDLTRFNEAIDQALAESVHRYSTDIDESKELFLGMLGHDLRTPLGAIYTSARFMLETNELVEPHRSLTQRISSSAERSIKMVGDLLDFTRSTLGGGIPIFRGPMNLGEVLREIGNELSAANPGRQLRLDLPESEVVGYWDGARLAQAFTNLIGNAFQHGSRGGVIRVTLSGEEGNVVVAIHNRGDKIPESELGGIFNPMKPRQVSRESAARGPTGSLGLGLHIAERIIAAHGGRVAVESSDEEGTTFTVHLPAG